MRKLNLLISSALVVMAFLPHQTLGMDDPLKPTKTISSCSFLSSLQTVASNTVGRMHESALNGCDQFGRWIAAYAGDLPPAYFAKSLLEVDYANDDLFWEGHFNQELEDIKESPYLGLQERKQLKELQDIVWNGLLSPYAYEKGLRELGKKSLFSKVKSIRGAFQSELKENPEIVLQHLRKDLIKSLEGMQNNKEGSEQKLLTKLEKKLTYYRNAMNVFDYAETLAGILARVEEQKRKLALSTIQHEGFKGSLSDALRKIDRQEYLQIKEERRALWSTQKTPPQEAEKTLQDQKVALTKAGNTESLSGVLEEDKPSSSYFSYPLSFAKGASTLIKQGICFVIENPTQAITMGLAFQAAAVAAKSSFSSPQLHKNQKMGSSSNTIDLSSLSPTQGFMIEGATTYDNSGWSVSSAGDFNGDGLSDVIVGAIGITQYAGSSYVIYGKKGGYSIPIDLAYLNVTQGVIIKGATSSDESGYSVSSAGDFNGDGLSDVIIGAIGTTQYAGSSYVIYGKKGGYSIPIDLTYLNVTQGVIIKGATSSDWSGASVGSAGDFNGDGLNDVIIGAPRVSPLGREKAGSSYVIYGKKGGYPTSIDLARLNATQGLMIEGASAGDGSGTSVNSAGDFNDDGINDVIVGAPYASPKGRKVAGSSYVIYGKKGGYPVPIDLARLNATQGLMIEGSTAMGWSGWSVGLAGDFNGDGLNDVIVGSPIANLQNRTEAGASYIIYGQKGVYPTPIDLAYLKATQGFMIKGASAGDWSGASVGSAGDFNGDGLNDVIIGSNFASPKGSRHAGSSYVIYGKKGGYPTPIDLARLNANQGVIIEGAITGANSGFSLNLAGDFNGDGLNDVIIGAYGTSPLGRNVAGASYVIYGKRLPLDTDADKRVKK